METDYISREAAYKNMFNIPNPNGAGEIEVVSVDDLEAIPAADVVPRDWHDRCMEIEIQNRIAADVRPVVHGEWIEIVKDQTDGIIPQGQFAFGCSVCREVFRMDERKSLDFMRFCPNCGAKMGGTP